MSLKVEVLSYEELTDEEKDNVANNGWGKENAYTIKVTHNGETKFLENDAVEPEDAMFARDFGWIPSAIEFAYKCGVNDAKQD